MNDTLDAICYVSLAHKLDAYPRETLPRIMRRAEAATGDGAELLALDEWLPRAGLTLETVPQVRDLVALHELAREGVYRRPKNKRCDPIRFPSHTLANGGDCDQWATVLLAVLWSWGLPAWLVTSGDDRDPYRHVYVETELDGAVYILDPKGSQVGSDFDVRSPHELHTRWQLTADELERLAA
jgi:hypothetical protein